MVQQTNPPETPAIEARTQAMQEHFDCDARETAETQRARQDARRALEHQQQRQDR